MTFLLRAVDLAPGSLKIVIISTLTWALASCGGGGITAGVGGSGIGGTGVTLVRGNVVAVTAALQKIDKSGGYARMLAGIAELVSSEAIAQAGGVSGIQVSGGGRQDVTDDLGRFDLIDVTPSANFVISLLLSDGQRIDLAIGTVPDRSAVEVNNIVIDSRQGSAQPSSVEIRDNSDDDSADSVSMEDNASTDDDSQDVPDDDSTGSGDQPDEPDEPDDNSADENKPLEDDDSTGDSQST